MRVSFDVEAFRNNPKGLISVLSHLRAMNQWSVMGRGDVEEIACKNPSSALSFCRHVVGNYGLSKEAERVFLKNPGIGVRYLRMVNRDHFQDEDTERRFRKKVCKDPRLALDWARTFNKRLSEDEEMVFAGDPWSAKEYSRYVVRGRLPDSVHERIMLRSFEAKGDLDKRYLKDYMDWISQYPKE